MAASKQTPLSTPADLNSFFSTPNSALGVHLNIASSSLFWIKDFTVVPFSGDQDSLTTTKDYTFGGKVVIKQGVCGWLVHAPRWRRLYISLQSSIARRMAKCCVFFFSFENGTGWQMTRNGCSCPMKPLCVQERRTRLPCPRCPRCNREGIARQQVWVGSSAQPFRVKSPEAHFITLQDS